jgi:hypothetical protein
MRRLTDQKKVRPVLGFPREMALRKTDRPSRNPFILALVNAALGTRDTRVRNAGTGRQKCQETQ